MVLGDFSYYEPKSMAEVEKLCEKMEDYCFYSGGVGLIWDWKNGIECPKNIISLQHIDQLMQIEKQGDVIYIGAGLTYAFLAEHTLMKSYLPSWVDMINGIADHPIRRKATLGGALVQNDSAQDPIAAILATGAILHTSKRKIKAEDWVVGEKRVNLAKDELLVKIEIDHRFKGVYQKFVRTSVDLPVVGVFIAKRSQNRVKVGITGAANMGFRHKEIEQALSEDFTASSLDRIKVNEKPLRADIHGGKDYRAHLIKVLTRSSISRVM